MSTSVVDSWSFQGSLNECFVYFAYKQVNSVPMLEVDMVYPNTTSTAKRSTLDSFREADLSVNADKFKSSNDEVGSIGKKSSVVASGHGVIVLFVRKQEAAPPTKQSKYTFADLVEASLCPRTSTQAWCDKCKQYVLNSALVLHIIDLLKHCGVSYQTQTGTSLSSKGHIHPHCQKFC